MEVPPPAPTAARNGGFTMPPLPSSSSQPSRKEWRVVSEQSPRNSATEELDRSKLVQSDERLIYEVQHGREPVDVDFCAITIDGDLDNNILQQRLHALAKKREELQHMEIELRAQNIARSEITRIHNTFDAQLKEHGNVNVKLQEQLHEKEQKIRELERKMEDKDRELHAIRLDNEAAWAKEDLLREQSKELQSYRRERDSSEAERVQHINQIRELQEHIQEKDRLFMELQEQHRIAQETIIFKEEQLREAQAWMTRAQEMDALQSTTNHTLQAELRERTEHYNQLWVACQRQFGEMERLHLHIQQLQLELVDAREKTGNNIDGSSISHKNLIDASKTEQSNGSQQDVNSNGSQSIDIGSLQNGRYECVPGGNTSTQADNVHVVAFAPSSLLGMPPYAPPGQVTALHPFVMHQQGVPHPSHVMQSHFHAVSTMPTIQNWQQGQPDGQHAPIHDQETEQNLVKTHSTLDYEASGNGQILHVNDLVSNISQGLDADSIPSANGDGKVLDSIGNNYDNTQSPESLQQVSSHFRDALNLNHLEHGNDSKPQEKQVNQVRDHGMENKSTMEHPDLAGLASSERVANVKNFSEKTTNNGSTTDTADVSVFAGQKNIPGNTAESYLLDERVLLASIARTIGSGGRIRISSTLPNRLGKMLAPLHWHDYKKKYGKLDDFVAGHSELFFIEGDYIQLREGAQETIAASAAVAKVAAAAAAAPSSYSSLLPSVAVTPMAQSHRLKKASPLDSSYVIVDKDSFNEFGGPRPLNVNDHPSQLSAAQSQNINGFPLRVPGGTSNVKILSKAKDHLELNGNETGFGRSTLQPVGKGGSHGRPGMSSTGKQHRAAVAVSNVRR
ncbi:uncharacterized protein LOC130993339 isoform X2 [Salvia miltiorrhiza]|uniref:uncharacterized protein LOC130993339 isoform X2 n=1 Tax=Salvia miltiorrhiza TaxID=226208 RepID=UPI0025ACC361|nr:uncharacterized protein LOC130993339 isoform X2 [Salvia miltiorrhiza]